MLNLSLIEIFMRTFMTGFVIVRYIRENYLFNKIDFIIDL